MALDSALKRASALNIGCPWRGVLPIPDGTVDEEDRPVLAYLYAFGAATPEPVPEPEPQPEPAASHGGGGSGSLYDGPPIVRRRHIADMLRAAIRVREAQSRNAKKRAEKAFVQQVKAVEGEVLADPNAGLDEAAALIETLRRLEETQGQRAKLAEILVLIDQIELMAPDVAEAIRRRRDDEEAIMLMLMLA